MRKIVTAALGISCRYFGLAVFCHMCHEVCRCSAICEKLDDLRCRRQRLVPLAIMETGIVDEISVAAFIPRLISVYGVLFLHAAKRKLYPLFCCLVMLIKEFHVTVHQIHLIRDPDSRVTPAYAVLPDVAFTGRSCQSHGGID